MSLMFSASCYSVVPGAVHGFMHGPRLCLTEVHGRVALRLAATPVAQPVAQPAPAHGAGIGGEFAYLSRYHRRPWT